MSDSLVRVSRRAEWGAHRPVPGARRYIAETARAANHDRRDGISTSLSTARALAAAPIRTGPRPESIGGPGYRRSHIRPGRIAGPHSLPSRQFQALFDSLFKVLFIFSLARVVPPDLGSRSKHRLKTTHWGPSSRASLTAHDARHNTRVFSTTTSRASTEGDSSLGQPHHKHGRPISAPMPCVPIRDAWLGGDAMRGRPGRRALGRMALGATCVQKLGWFTGFCNSHQVSHFATYMFTGRSALQGFDNDPSAGSPTETLLRLLLPLNDKVQWNSRDVRPAANRPRRRDPNTSPDHSIGRSDGRCVQRAGT
ncbi:hypothetical protein L1887_61787 [Cichorium endivia]|nr:hypothetical protein L1887_61787 [Cichorium endivia]